MQKLKLSVIVRCYNAEKTLAVQLEALARQDWEHSWELIVVDNRCADHSMEIVRQYAARIEHLRVVKAWAKQGQAYALNVGIAAADSEAVAICDADDQVASAWVRAMGDALSHHDFVAGRITLEGINPPWVIEAFGDHCQSMGLQRATFPPYFDHAGSGNMGMKRALWELVGGFDESLTYLEDVEFCFRVQARTETRLHFVPDAILHCRYRPTRYRLFRQTVRWAAYETLLFKMYRPSDSYDLWRWRAYGQDWIWLLRNIRGFFTSEAKCSTLVWQLGRQIGLLKGAVRYCVPPTSGGRV